MPKPKAIDTTKIKTTAQVLERLSELNEQLSDMNLSSVIVFNKAYYEVTRSIKAAARDNQFVNPDFIEKFSVCFANYYFTAINDYLTESSDLPSAWLELFRSDHNDLPSFAHLLMGANAHINYDLPLSLSDVINKSKPELALKDIVKIDKLLIGSGKRILDQFNETNRLANFIKRYLKAIYFRPILYMILCWRVIAWRNYKSIVQGRLARRTAKISTRLIFIGRLTRH